MEEIKNDLLVYKSLVNQAREAGMKDIEIIELLGVSTVVLSKKSELILRAIKSGKIKANTPSVAKFIGATRGAALYHLNKIKAAGLL